MLYDHLKEYNEIPLDREIPGPFSYPLKVRNGQALRNELIKEKIYIPCLWPNVVEDARISDFERECVENILPIPCDQRYHTDEMMRIIHIVFDYYNR